MIAMIEAARTTTSPAGLWLVVIVAVACLAFWLGMLAIVSQDPGGARRRRRIAEMQGPVVGGTHVSDCGRSVAPSRRSGAVFAVDETDAFAAAAAAAAPPAAPAAAGTGVAGAGATGAGVTVPGQRTEEPAPVPSPSPAPGQATPVMPTQRTGDADRPRHARR